MKIKFRTVLILYIVIMIGIAYAGDFFPLKEEQNISTEMST